MIPAWQRHATCDVFVVTRQEEDMITADMEITKHCVAFGGLDGAKFAKVLADLRLRLGRLEAFAGNLNDELEVAPPPIHSVGVEVDRDAVVIAHIDQRLAEAASRVIDLMAMTRMAKVALERAGSADAV
jgi:hypothetical protein